MILAIKTIFVNPYLGAREVTNADTIMASMTGTIYPKTLEKYTTFLNSNVLFLIS